MFNKLTGNENVKHTLRRMLAKGRVPSSILFTGDEGIGKKRFALELAKATVCLDKTETGACDLCSVCVRSTAFTMPASDDRDAFKRVIFSDHPDVGLITPYNRSILVDAIRHLESEANYRPYEAESRFFIIDNADRMNEAASNALLKTLEEPPVTSHIFLITSRPDSLLPTIRSRCQTIRFAPVSTEDIEKHLLNGLAFSHDEARLAARLSRGSIGRAVSLNVKGFRDRRELMLAVLVNAIEARDIAVLLKISEEMNDAKNKQFFEEDLDTLQSLIHDIWTLAVGGIEDRVANGDLTDRLRTLSQNSETARLAAWLSEIDLLRENLAVNVNRKVAADSLFVGMTA